MTPGFIDLPLEIRLEIYGLVFGSGKTLIETKNEDDGSSLLPQNSTFQSHLQRSSQLLRVSKAILVEARPILYANTTFHVLTQVFAGKLPTNITNGHPCAPYVKHLIWQLDCDILKHFYPEDLRFPLEASQWSSFEIRCRAEMWRDSFLGEWCDREAFVKGRDQILGFANVFHLAMSGPDGAKINIIEDRSQLGRGRVIMRLSRGRSTLEQEVGVPGDSEIIPTS